jgi:predicted GNAT family acetyltransferase
VAAIGNVATHPDARGQGLGKTAVSALCHRLLATVDDIALNVKADNTSAIALYRGLGFARVGEFHQLLLS